MKLIINYSNIVNYLVDVHLKPLRSLQYLALQ